MSPSTKSNAIKHSNADSEYINYMHWKYSTAAQQGFELSGIGLNIQFLSSSQKNAREMPKPQRRMYSLHVKQEKQLSMVKRW